MNILFLDDSELTKPLLCTDPRAKHIIEVLKKGVKDSIRAGLASGSLGSIIIEKIDNSHIHFAYKHEKDAPSLYNLVLLLGMPRPIQAKRLVKDLASLGLRHIILCGTELGEKSYIDSNFFKNEEYKEAIIEGAVQAGNPRLAGIEKAWTLKKAILKLEESYPALKGSNAKKWALDPYRANINLGQVSFPQAHIDSPLVLAIGNERGWTENELACFEAYGFSFAALGNRILKTETAAVVAVSIALSRLALL